MNDGLKFSTEDIKNLIEVDLGFYKKNHKDLKRFSESDLYDHYANYGYKEFVTDYNIMISQLAGFPSLLLVYSLVCTLISNFIFKDLLYLNFVVKPNVENDNTEVVVEKNSKTNPKWPAFLIAMGFVIEYLEMKVEEDQSLQEVLDLLPIDQYQK